MPDEQHAIHIGELNRQRLDKHERTLESISGSLSTMRQDLDELRSTWAAQQKAQERSHSLLTSLLVVTIIGVFGFFSQIIMSARWAATTDALLLGLDKGQNRLEMVVLDHEKRIRTEEISPH